MTDQPLEDPNGAPYPSTVQAFMTQHFPDLEEWDDQAMRRELRDAIEAAIAVDRERRPPAPELDDDQVNVLANLYLSGIASGTATTLLQAEATDQEAQVVAMALVARVADDPAVRYDICEMVQRFWRERPEQSTWQRFTSYSQPRNHRDD